MMKVIKVSGNKNVKEIKCPWSRVCMWQMLHSLAVRESGIKVNSTANTSNGLSIHSLCNVLQFSLLPPLLLLTPSLQAPHLPQPSPSAHHLYGEMSPSSLSAWRFKLFHNSSKHLMLVIIFHVLFATFDLLHVAGGHLHDWMLPRAKRKRLKVWHLNTAETAGLSAWTHIHTHAGRHEWEIYACFVRISSS